MSKPAIGFIGLGLMGNGELQYRNVGQVYSW
ncbi:hypothetical protein amad1_15235 [Alteromonas mediterranea DE1]|jgi:hypothetical protein|uniref:Uncharacterized protein n=1 Tax=Alteromonas mediterranea (strain DSM 17117 / CIP 110805 / LMG 28347 / Deep ecotype) TaxID=1774373 RepID=F2GD43_ALTMD|nr:hypothetical protein MADE_1015290 [Alteromonas mediterranea DE]AFV86541.1 hypothetical protein amad1_15235 [Alteromonas mediterranea DE1]AGP82831.1 hypothetical protein I533_14355 [Alteromonas mediterranea MED64]AGP86692.1 hypothetical protein I607_14535 [Alteromonas mediterranea U4]AGP90813.1 hypothetical protein I876_14830 [Alteromonas mediterranea U7]AGP94650.1 hypothetical protein I634_14775 [Alteromonas mediterranea U8]AGP98552.1 hypothetical protein I635_15205 [Alteromonas mediterran